jgi:hypothetical protein
MQIFFSIAVLVIFGSIVKILLPFFLYLLNLPGRLIVFPNALGKCGRPRFISGVVVTVLLQSYLCLAYTAFITNWTMLAMRKHGDSFVVLFAALFAVIFPLGAVSIDAKMKAEAAECLYRKNLDESAQNKANDRERILDIASQASSITFLLSLAGFAVFAFSPGVIKIMYGWMPFYEFCYPVLKP